MPSQKVRMPTLWKMIEADYAAWLSVVVPVVLWIFFLFLYFTKIGGPDITNMISPISVVTAIALTGLAIRYTMLRAHFAKAELVPGKIVRYMHLQDIGRVIYTYTFGRQDYRTVNFVHNSIRTIHLERLEEIRVAVNPDRPQSALIYDLYAPKTEEDDDEE